MAAIAVLLVHVWGVTKNIEPVSGKSIYSFGQAGVDLFFVISGFIIAMITAAETSPRRFLWRRAVRIYPFYWIFSLAWLAMLISAGKPVPGSDLIVLSLIGAPLSVPPILGVGWSLEHEFIFYFIAAILLGLGRPGWLFATMAILAGTSLLLNVFWPHSMAQLDDAHLLSLYHFQFLLGVGLYAGRERLSHAPALLLIGVGAVLFPITAALLSLLYGGPIPTQPFGSAGIARVTLFGVASAMLLAGLIAMERQRPTFFKARITSRLAALGDASYGLYLSHSLVIASLSVAFTIFWPKSLPPLLAVCLAFGLSIGFSLLWFRFAERPFLQMWEKWM